MISVCTMLHNEEIHVENMLNSILPIASEINILDNGCTDNTMNIVRRIAAENPHIKFNYAYIPIQHVHCFASLRNAMISMSTQKWILMIDGDEVAEYDRDQLLKVLDETNDDGIVYQVKRINLLDDDYKDTFDIQFDVSKYKDESSAYNNRLHFWEPQRKIFRNDSKIFYFRRVHEEPTNYREMRNLGVFKIVHFNYTTKDKTVVSNRSSLYNSIIDNGWGDKI